MHHRIRLVVVAMLSAVVLIAAAGGAKADNGGTGGQSTSNGFVVQAQVTFSGDAAPGGGGTVTMGVPSKCWWSPVDQGGGGSAYVGIKSDDPSTWLAWYDQAFAGNAGTTSFARVGLGPRSAWEAAVANGGALSVYHATCIESAGLCSADDFVGGPGVQGGAPLGGCLFRQTYNFYPTGNPPAPQVDPEQLAIIARDNMVIVDPRVDRNPKVAGLNAATLVGLPTWFWVTNPASVGGNNGRRTITATVGAVFATVVAQTTGLVINTPRGGVTCAPALALRAYTDGAPDSAGCVFRFDKASVGYSSGYPIQASTTWTATWTGTGGAGGEIDGPVGGNAQFNVPVAESQAITTASH